MPLPALFAQSHERSIASVNDKLGSVPYFYRVVLAKQLPQIPGLDAAAEFEKSGLPVKTCCMDSLGKIGFLHC